MGSSEDFGPKNGNSSCLNAYMKIHGRRGQGHSLTFDPGLTIF